jgi:hypothetical protein
VGGGISYVRECVWCVSLLILLRATYESPTNHHHAGLRKRFCHCSSIQPIGDVHSKAAGNLARAEFHFRVAIKAGHPEFAGDLQEIREYGGLRYLHAVNGAKWRASRHRLQPHATQEAVCKIILVGHRLHAAAATTGGGGRVPPPEVWRLIVEHLGVLDLQPSGLATRPGSIACDDKLAPEGTATVLRSNETAGGTMHPVVEWFL